MKFISLSQYPGKQGQYFYNSFFKLYNIQANYIPEQATFDSLKKR